MTRTNESDDENDSMNNLFLYIQSFWQLGVCVCMSEWGGGGRKCFCNEGTFKQQFPPLCHVITKAVTLSHSFYDIPHSLSLSLSLLMTHAYVCFFNLFFVVAYISCTYVTFFFLLILCIYLIFYQILKVFQNYVRKNLARNKRITQRTGSHR